MAKKNTSTCSMYSMKIMLFSAMYIITSQFAYSQFEEGTEISHIISPYTYQDLADINGDGADDIIACSDTKFMFFANINGTYQYPRTFYRNPGEFEYFPKILFAHDFNNDQIDEVFYENDGVHILHYMSDSETWQSFPFTPYIQEYQIVDMNSDGIEDFTFRTPGGGVAIRILNAEGILNSQGADIDISQFQTLGGIDTYEFIDFDCDGDQDLFCVRYNDLEYYEYEEPYFDEVYLSNANQLDGEFTTIELGLYSHEFTGDENKDLVFSGKGVMGYFPTSCGVFSPLDTLFYAPWPEEYYSTPFDPIFTDFNQDGCEDILLYHMAFEEYQGVRLGNCNGDYGEILPIEFPETFAEHPIFAGYENQLSKWICITRLEGSVYDDRLQEYYTPDGITWEEGQVITKNIGTLSWGKFIDSDTDNDYDIMLNGTFNAPVLRRKFILPNTNDEFNWDFLQEQTAQYRTHGDGYKVAFYDFDLDGRTDMTYHVEFSTYDSLYVFLNQDDLLGHPDIDFTHQVSQDMRGIRYVDVDGDGYTDIRTNSNGSYYRNLITDVDFTSTPLNQNAIDINFDGLLDAPVLGSSSINFYSLGEDPGTYISYLDMGDVGNYLMAAYWLNLKNDGFPEFIIETQNSLQVYNIGTSFNIGSAPMEIQNGDGVARHVDLNMDGFMDLYWLKSNKLGIDVKFNLGNLEFSDLMYYPFGESRTCNYLEFVDINGNGILDALTTSSSYNDVYLHKDLFEGYYLNSPELTGNNPHEKIKVFPNPCSDLVTVLFEGTAEQVQVSDLYGNILVNHIGPLKEINTSEFSAGLYFVQIFTPNEKYVCPLVVK